MQIKHLEVNYMKKVLLIVILLLVGAVLYAGIESMFIKIQSPKSITNYAGTTIYRYDLGDVECFISKVGMHCLRK